MFLNVTQVDTPEDVPNIPICWIKAENKFAFRIDGNLIMGNMGEIYTKHTPKNIMHNVTVCKYDEKCNNQDCKFLHISKANKQLNNAMNYNAASWLYTPDLLKPNNKLMRHIGNKSTLYNDLEMLYNQFSKKNIDTYLLRDMHMRIKSQLMHDLLTYEAFMKTFHNVLDK